MVKSAKSLILLGTASLLIACGEQAEVIELPPVAMPQDHGRVEPAEPGGPRQVVLPETLQGRFTQAMMRVQLPGSEQAVTLQLPLTGEPRQTEQGTLLVRDYLPAFLISGNTITSEGVEEKNPAIWAEWHHNGNKVFAGWLFRDYPTLNPMLLPDYQLTFIGAN